MTLWKFYCMEDTYPGMWPRWFLHQCVGVAVSPVDAAACWSARSISLPQYAPRMAAGHLFPECPFACFPDRARAPLPAASRPPRHVCAAAFRGT